MDTRPNERCHAALDPDDPLSGEQRLHLKRQTRDQSANEAPRTQSVNADAVTIYIHPVVGMPRAEKRSGA